MDFQSAEFKPAEIVASGDEVEDDGDMARKLGTPDSANVGIVRTDAQHPEELVELSQHPLECFEERFFADRSGALVVVERRGCRSDDAGRDRSADFFAGRAAVDKFGAFSEVVKDL